MKNLIAIVLLLFSIAGQAQTLLVSDVDDTIKLANVKDLSSAAHYAFDEESRFLGMSELYNLIVKDRPETEVVYLSRAPEWFMGRTHRKFLRNGKFPQGTYIPRTDYSSDIHKIQTLRDLLEEKKPRKVILIGDNGEQDAEIYAQIVKEYANQGVEFYQFIRVVYSKNAYMDGGALLLQDQMGFVTPVEMALELEKNHLLETSSVQWVMEKLVPQILMQKSHAAEGEVAFPFFVSCGDLKWTWDDSLARFEIMKSLKDRIVTRCKIKP